MKTRRLPGRRSLLAAALAVVVASVASAPARTAASNPATALARHRAPAGAVRATSGPNGRATVHPSRRPADYLSRPTARTALRKQRMMDEERKALAATWGIDYPDPIAEARKTRDARAAGPAPADDSFDIRFVSAYAGGDLDGDGLADVITQDTLIRITFTDTDVIEDVVHDTITATRGVTGATLWTRTAEHDYVGFALPAGDLDGDGADDVLFVNVTTDSVTGPDECAVVACLFDRTYEFHWTMDAAAGRDAAPLWSRPFPGQARVTGGYASGLVAFAEAVLLQVTNDFVVPAPAGDLNHDGRRDVIFNAYDVTETFAFGDAGILVGALAFFDLPLVATHGSVSSGADGAVFFERARDSGVGGAALFSAADAVGDATQDLLWSSDHYVLTPIVCAIALVTAACAYAEHDSADVEMIDGGTLTTAWSASLDDPSIESAFAYPALTDLDGDGRADVLVDEYTGTELTSQEQQGVIAGSDGRIAWVRPFAGYVFPIGSVDGGAGDDLLAASFSFDDSTFAITLRLERADGATGAPLLITTHTYGETSTGFTDVFGYLLGDSDGDGVADVALDTITYDFQTGQDSSSVLVESGKTGSAIFTRSVEGDAFTAPAGDLDADGLADLYDHHFDWQDQQLDLSAVTLPAGSTKWVRHDTFGGSFFGEAFGIADLTGDARTDAGYFRDEFDPQTGAEHLRFDALDGADGSILWGFGDDVGGGSSATGGIAGAVSDAGGPLEGICVTASNSSTSRQATTSPAGTYLLSHVPDGTYTVRYDDCATGSHVTQWFDGKTDPAQADPVVVSGPGVTTGIDAVLALVPPPENDDIANAAQPASLPYTDLINTAGATVQDGEPTDCGLEKTAWYRYTPASLGLLSVSASSDATFLTIGWYEGPDADHLTWKGCGNYFSHLATPGTTYWYQVGTEPGSPGGPMRFDLSSTP